MNSKEGVYYSKSICSQHQEEKLRNLRSVNEPRPTFNYDELIQRRIASLHIGDYNPLEQIKKDGKQVPAVGNRSVNTTLKKQGIAEIIMGYKLQKPYHGDELIQTVTHDILEDESYYATRGNVAMTAGEWHNTPRSQQFEERPVSMVGRYRIYTTPDSDILITENGGREFSVVAQGLLGISHVQNRGRETNPTPPGRDIYASAYHQVTREIAERYEAIFEQFMNTPSLSRLIPQAGHTFEPPIQTGDADVSFDIPDNNE